MDQTSRHLKIRVQEYEKSTRPHNWLNTRNKINALAEHSEGSCHQSNFKITKVIGGQTINNKILFEEMIKIKKLYK